MQQTPPSKSSEAGSQNANAGGSGAGAGASTPTGKTKKRERSESSSAIETSKRERASSEEAAGGESRSEQMMHLAMEELEKEGVSSVASVEKLVSAMQQDRSDGSRKSIECAGRRTLLAAAIAGSDNHECLERFVQLGGVALFHEWLQEAYKGKCEGESPKDGVSKVVEELLLMILSALEKLPVDLQALRCQVGKSVNNLKSHRNVEIKEKARKLVETWKKRVGDEMNLPAGSKAGAGSGASQWSTNIKSTEIQPAAGVQGSNGIYKTSSPSEKASQNNGQVYPAAGAALGWKEEVKNSTTSLPSPGSKSGHRASNPKGSSGLNPAAGKELPASKPAGWSRDKGELPAPDSSGTKVVLRLPRSVSAGLNEEVFGPGSQGSSPSLPDQTTGSSFADAPDAKQRQVSGAGKSEPPAEQQAQDESKPEQKEAERRGEASPSSDGNGRAVSLAIVPASAISRISGNVVGLSVRSMVMSTGPEAGVVAETPIKEEARRKELQERGDGANCASSSSFTEMSVAGQGAAAAVEHKSELSSAGGAQDGDENSRPPRVMELEGLGESPEPRPSLRRSSGGGGDQVKTADAEKRAVPADVSSTKPAAFVVARCSGYEGLGRRPLERYDNSWEEKRGGGGGDYFPTGKKSSSEAESRKEPGLKSPDFKAAQEVKMRVDSASEFGEDDALEVAQQIAKEVEQEVETSHLSSTKDEREHLKDPVSSPGKSPEKSPESDPAEKPEDNNIPPMEKEPPESSNSPEPSQLVAEKEGEKEQNEELVSPEAARAPAMAVEDEKVNPCQPAASSSAEEEKPAEITQSSSRPDFDLNEGLGGDDGGLKEAASQQPVAGPTTPKPVLPKGAFIPPESLMKAKSEPGWKGSAATSAFRPAEPRRVQESHHHHQQLQQQQQQQSQSSTPESREVRQPRPPLDIDLNVADTEPETTTISSFISKPFSEKNHNHHHLQQQHQQQQPASTSGRVDFDLNSDGCEDEAPALDTSVGLGRRDAVHQGASTTRDFDLNGPVEEEPGVQLRTGADNPAATMVQPPPSMTGFRLGTGAGTGELTGVAPWFPSGNSFPAVAIPAFPMARAETSYPVQAQPFLNAAAGSAGAIHFNVDLYRGGMTLATPAVAYGPANPPVPYPYAAAGFPFASNYSFNTPASFPASFVESNAGANSGSYPVSSQISGPGSMSRFIRPHLMGIGEAAAGVAAGAGVGRGDGSSWPVRPGLDLNTGPDVSEDLRPQGGGGGGRVVALEDHLRGFGQVAATATASAPPTGKRKEPESGWEAFQAGYKQPAWC